MRFFYFLFFVEYKSLNFCGLTCPSPWEASPAIQKKIRSSRAAAGERARESSYVEGNCFEYASYTL